MASRKNAPNDGKRTAWLQVRLSADEYAMMKAIAAERDRRSGRLPFEPEIDMSRVVREFIFSEYARLGLGMVTIEPAVAKRPPVRSPRATPAQPAWIDEESRAPKNAASPPVRTRRAKKTERKA